ncbi:MAG: DUF5715 family protein [Acidobacteriaceae bacterium]
MRAAVLLFLFVYSGSLFAGDRHSLVADGSSQLIQNDQADDANLSRMQNVAMVQRFAKHGYLVRVSASSRYYYLHAVSPNERFCRPWTKLFLDRLSRQYYSRFKQRLRVTSLVRTERSQRRLARWNENAADASGALASSHLTGATLDISKRWMSPEGQQWIRDVLYSLREAGYLYAIEEFQQPTFHIMVYPGYPQYVRGLKHRTRTPDLADSRVGAPTEAD